MKIPAKFNSLLGGSQLARIISIAVLVVVFGLPACQTGFSGQDASIRIGLESTAVNSLVFIAESQGYFAANHLDVSIEEYPSGLASVNGMLANEVDLATAAEFVIVGKALANERILTLGAIDKFMHNYLIARRDQGIEKVEDLKGKRIGLPLKTAAEFYLGRFIELRGMNAGQVTLVDVAPAQLVDALVNGEVDAVIAWQPNAKTLEDRLGDGIVKWPVQNAQVSFCTVIASSAWAAENPELVERFLNSLAQADAFTIRQPAEAQAIIQERLNYDDEYMSTIWPNHQLQLSLDQSLILALEDEARWMIKNNLTSEKQTPDFLEYIYLEGLLAVKPEAVNIIR